MLKQIDQWVLKETSDKAKGSARLRMNHNFHELDDPVQRMLNAIEPGSYCQPHRHLDPDKVELFLALKGKGGIVTFDDSGKVEQAFSIEAGGETIGVEIPAGVWHTILSLEEGAVFFEVKEGPYLPGRAKDFAPWAPAEGDEGADEYLENLVSLF